MRSGLCVQRIWGALWPGQHAVGFFVVMKTLCDRIPVQAAPGLHRDVMQQACGAGSMTDLRGSSGNGSAADAIEPVAMLIIALVEVNFVRPDHRVQDLWIARLQRLQFGLRPGGIGSGCLRIARDEDPPLRSVELDAVRKVAADVHGHAIRVDGMSKKLAVDVPKPMRRELR